MGSGAKWIDETNRPVNDLDPHEDRETAFDLGHESAFNTRGGPRPAFTRGLHARYASCWQSAAVGDQVNEYDGKIGKKKRKKKKGKKGRKEKRGNRKNLVGRSADCRLGKSDDASKSD